MDRHTPTTNAISGQALAGKLRQMLADEKGAPAHYRAGPYWANSTRNIANQLLARGLDGFRGYDSGVGTGFCDNVVTDFRNEFDYGIKRLAIAALNVTPLRKLVDLQAHRARMLHEEFLAERQRVLSRSETLMDLLAAGALADTTRFGCVHKCTLFGTAYSLHYLTLFQRYANIRRHIDFGAVRSLFEIGGGFGVNVHILLQNHPGIRKVLYLDMVPNLLVGQEYLRQFFRDAVVDYASMRGAERIRFRGDDSLEILCIAPWQIERVDEAFDFFHNAHSFVEMPYETAENYARFARVNMAPTGEMCLVSYGAHDPSTTFTPDRLAELFGSPYAAERYPLLEADGFNNYYFFKVAS